MSSTEIFASKKLGIVGGGQLGRMLAEAAHELGIQVTVLDPTPDSPAGQIADRQIVGNFTDPAAIRELATVTDVLTFEIESADATTLVAVAKERPDTVHPAPETLSIIRDKYLQKQFLADHGIPVAPFLLITNEADVLAAAEQFGYPLVLKTRFGAYDGRGNATIASSVDISGAMEKLNSRELYVEQFIPFTKELAVVAARTREGAIALYPVVETIQENHICHMVMAPAPILDSQHKQATAVAAEVLRVLGGAGVFGIELFLTVDGDVLVNEIAPRVHNSGHFTIEGCATSQFSQHVRAVVGMPLGAVTMNAPFAVMINILGERSGRADPQGMKIAESLGNVAVHLYGKQEVRPARKMGHITATASSLDEAVSRAKQARGCVTI